MRWISLVLCFPLVISFMSFIPVGDKERKQWREHDIQFIQRTLELKYAPRAWKEEYLHLSFNEIFQNTLKEVSRPSMSAKEFQTALRRMLYRLADYHVGISFYSTEEARLPFTVKSVSGTHGRRYLVASIDPKSNVSLRVGDEILSWNDLPIQMEINRLKSQGALENRPETEQAFAEKKLTLRCGEEGVLVPQGAVILGVQPWGSSAKKTVHMIWNYTPNGIPDSQSFKPFLASFSPSPAGDLTIGQFINKRMMACSSHHPSLAGSPHEMSRRNSFFPRLGSVQWETKPEEPFDAYVTRLSSGKRVGYLRIPNFLGGPQDLTTFRELISLFNQETDCLVIDQINNPGGELFYLYGLLQALTDRSLEVPQHAISLTQEEIFLAVQVASFLDSIHSDRDANEKLAPYLSGYQADLQFVDELKLFIAQLMSSWEAGALCTDPIPLMGIQTIRPLSPSHGYHKPILLLVNELDFSCADFFAAILQDNQRAILMGRCTAGAGGYVCSATYPNRNGIAEFHFTGSLARRVSGLPIENLGIEPNLLYDLTADDVCFGYGDYADSLEYVVNTML